MNKPSKDRTESLLTGTLESLKSSGEALHFKFESAYYYHGGLNGNYAILYETHIDPLSCSI